MPFIQAPQATAALTVNGTADGWITVADSSPFWPGAHVWLHSGTVTSKEYVITEVKTGNLIGLRETFERDGAATYTRTPVNQFLVADGARIDQESQVVPAELSNLAKVVR